MCLCCTAVYVVVCHRSVFSSPFLFGCVGITPLSLTEGVFLLIVATFVPLSFFPQVGPEFDVDVPAWRGPATGILTPPPEEQQASVHILFCFLSRLFFFFCLRLHMVCLELCVFFIRCANYQMMLVRKEKVSTAELAPYPGSKACRRPVQQYLHLYLQASGCVRTTAVRFSRTQGGGKARQGKHATLPPADLRCFSPSVAPPT